MARVLPVAPLGPVLLAAGLGVAYFVASKAGLAFVTHTDHVAVLWPASGIAFACALLAPPRWGAAIVAGVFAGNLAAQVGARHDLGLAVVLACVNAVEPLVAAGVARRRAGAVVGGDDLRGLQALLIGAAVGATAAGLAGAAALGVALGTPLLTGWATWALADGLGMVLVAPLLLALRDRRSAGDADRRGFLLAVAAVLVAAPVFLAVGDPGFAVLEYPYATFPFLIWVAVRGARGPTALATTGVGVLAVLGTVAGRGPFADGTDGLEAVVAVQGYLVAVLVGVALTSAAVRGRRSAAAEAQDAAERYRQLVGAMPDAICALFDPRHRLLLLEGASLGPLGIDAAALLGRPLEELVTADRCAELRPLFEQASRGRSGRSEHVSAFTDAACEVEVAPLRDADGDVVGVFVLSRDVSERHRRDLELRTAHDDMRAMFDTATIAQLVLAADGRVERANAALVQMVDGAVGVGFRLDVVFGPDEAQRIARRIALVRAGGRPGAELELTTESGSAVTAHVCGLSGGRVLVQLVDVTERRRHEAQLRHMADHDSLTGLANRRLFELELGRQLEQARRYGEAGAVCVLDVDHFKQVNDTLGHKAGDDLIVGLARLLRDRLRSSDVLARLGGDEFAVLLPRATRDDAETVAAELVRVVREGARELGGPAPRQITVSVGVAMVDGGPAPASAEELMIAADLAMYDAKAAGRDRYAVYADGRVSASGTEQRLHGVDRVETALRDDGFVLFAQPIEHLATGTVDRHELLLRMTGETGLVLPGAFLPTAERHGLAPRIDRWVLGRAIGLLAEIDARGGSHRFEVNVSGRSLGDAGLLQHVEDELRRTGVDPGSLIIEITETAAIADLAAAREFVDRLTRLGCRFALDDFGAGFGSFYYLKHLPSDYLKIDGEFVRGCATCQDDRLVIRSLVEVARGMGKRTIAEFVTDDAVRRCVAELGVDFAQGYHVGRPVPVDLDLLSRPPALPLPELVR